MVCLSHRCFSLSPTLPPSLPLPPTFSLPLPPPSHSLKVSGKIPSLLGEDQERRRVPHRAAVQADTTLSPSFLKSKCSVCVGTESEGRCPLALHPLEVLHQLKRRRARPHGGPCVVLSAHSLVNDGASSACPPGAGTRSEKAAWTPHHGCAVPRSGEGAWPPPATGSSRVWGCLLHQSPTAV